MNEFCCGPYISSLNKRYRNEEIRPRQATEAFEDVPVLSVDCTGQKAVGYSHVCVPLPLFMSVAKYMEIIH